MDRKKKKLLFTLIMVLLFGGVVLALYVITGIDISDMLTFLDDKEEEEYSSTIGETSSDNTGD